MEKKNTVKTLFSYTNELGNVTTLEKTHDIYAINEGSLPFLVDEFKLFLLAVGYTEESVNKIEYV